MQDQEQVVFTLSQYYTRKIVTLQWRNLRNLLSQVIEVSINSSRKINVYHLIDTVSQP